MSSEVCPACKGTGKIEVEEKERKKQEKQKALLKGALASFK